MIMSLPSHCLENSVFFHRGDYLNFDKLSNGVKTSLKFAKIPDFHTIDEESYFAAEMRIEGLKVMTAALAADDVLNIRLQESKCLEEKQFSFVHQLLKIYPKTANNLIQSIS
ncbi:uncharacterized protein LOC135163557 isoform X2 [Diachasmimorpha longicaudata]|uniref:uncharacterized protein LOC135163557 isoform X2 n=1 Tax=Diachasmimorpha longicaudata TaxID=58733 RepID=UPI0030B8FF15